MGIFTKLLEAVSGGSSDTLPENAILIDVRSPDEFNSGHIEGAVSCPLDLLTSAIGKFVPEMHVPVIVYCRSGARSASAKIRMLKMGYTNVINGGGVHALSQRMNKKICR